jgi:hypothetical protein
MGTVDGIANATWDKRKLPGAEQQNLDARVDRVCARLQEGHVSLLPYTRGGINRGGRQGLKGIARSMGLKVNTRHRRNHLLNAVCALKTGGEESYIKQAHIDKEFYKRYVNDSQWRERHTAYTKAKGAAHRARKAMVMAEKELREREAELDSSVYALDISGIADDFGTVDFLDNDPAILEQLSNLGDLRSGNDNLLQELEYLFPNGVPEDSDQATSLPEQYPELPPLPLNLGQ